VADINYFKEIYHSKTNAVFHVVSKRILLDVIIQKFTEKISLLKGPLLIIYRDIHKRLDLNFNRIQLNLKNLKI